MSLLTSLAPAKRLVALRGEPPRAHGNDEVGPRSGTRHRQGGRGQAAFRKLGPAILRSRCRSPGPEPGGWPVPCGRAPARAPANRADASRMVANRYRGRRDCGWQVPEPLRRRSVPRGNVARDAPTVRPGGTARAPGRQTAVVQLRALQPPVTPGSGIRPIPGKRRRPKPISSDRCGAPFAGGGAPDRAYPHRSVPPQGYRSAKRQRTRPKPRIPRRPASTPGHRDPIPPYAWPPHPPRHRSGRPSARRRAVGYFARVPRLRPD